MDWNKIMSEVFGWVEKLLTSIFPWWGKVQDVLGAIVVMVEKAAETNDIVKRQEAIDTFEKFLVSKGYVPAPIEGAFDSILDWAIGWAIDKLIEYLNAKFGKDWVTKVLAAPTKSPTK